MSWIHLCIGYEKKYMFHIATYIFNLCYVRDTFFSEYKKQIYVTNNSIKIKLINKNKIKLNKIK